MTEHFLFFLFAQVNNQDIFKSIAAYFIATTHATI